MKRLLLVVLALLCVLVSAGATQHEETLLNVVRVNVGGLLIGPFTGVYGVEVAYERVLEDWLGWNFSVWGLDSPPVLGFGIASSLDFFFIGDAPSGIFLNARTGYVSGEVYGIPTGALQIGLSAGFQNVFPSRFVLRVGTGGSYVVGNRFLPRAIVSVGVAF